MKHIHTVAILIGILPVLVLGGCGGGHTGHHNHQTSPKSLHEVDLSFTPQQPAMKQPVTFTAKVTMEGKPIKADEITFEVWREGQEPHESIKAKSAGEGVYTLEKTFELPGTYYVISHVTVGAGHVMPKKTFVVK